TTLPGVHTVKPNTPVGKALTDAGVDTGAGTVDTGKSQGEQLSDIQTKRKAREAAATKAAGETATANTEMDRNIKIVEEWLNNPRLDEEKKPLPQGMGGAAASTVVGPARAWMARQRGNPGASFLQLSRTKVLPALRAMEGGAKNMRIAGQVMGEFGINKQMDDLANLRMTPAQLDQFRSSVRQDLSRIRNELAGGGESSSATTLTPTSTTTTSSFATGGQLGAGSGVTPGGRRYRILPQP